MAKKIEDKTFGMKNKNKSKAVQQQINQMKSSAGLGAKGVRASRRSPPGRARQPLSATVHRRTKTSRRRPRPPP